MIKSVNMPYKFDSPEFQLLLSCCSVNPSKEDRYKRAEAIGHGIDEQYFLKLVRRHLVAPIVYHSLHNEIGISDQLKESLRNIVKQNQFKALIAKQMVTRLQKKFIELNIKAIFFKGLSVSEIYYKDPALRDIQDIDLWVESSGFIKTCEYLKSLGYRSNLDLSKLNKKQIAYKYLTDHHLLFTHHDPSFPKVIELHWKLRGRLGVFTFDPEQEYDDIVFHCSNAVDLPVFSEIDNFLFLCTHGCDHAWYRLKWLFDLPQILDNTSMDWEKVMKRAEELNCTQQVMIAFCLLKRFFNRSIPLIIEDIFKKSNLSWLLRYIERCILYEGDFSDTDKEKIYYLYYTLLLNKKGFLNKAIILRHLTSEKDWKQFPLPESLFFLYFPLRPFLLLYRRLIRSFVHQTSV